MLHDRSPTTSRRTPHATGPLGWAAAGLGGLWVSVIALALVARLSSALLVLGGAGLLLSVAFFVIARGHQDRLRGLAATDALTGLVNHRGFHEALAAALDDARRERQPLTLVILDLDNFKMINDTHGHPYGDEVLRGVGTKLSGVVRGSDTAARVGGEEFALILPDTPAEPALTIAERARAAIATVAVHGFELSCSAGVAAYPGDADDGATLCQLADGALYWAKRSGKRRTRRFDPEHVRPAWTERQREEIEALLEPEAIEPVFQPVVALATGGVVGYEALARFPSSPDRAPAALFAQAHGCGLGAALEAAAIRAALTALGQPLDTHLALNISPSTLADRALRAALPADLSRVVIEITEHELVGDDSVVAAAISDLRSRGARIAIDDAGAGYAGLKQVMQVRPDIVKLDRELTRAIHQDRARMALIESFVRFTRRVGAVVCAEGIESLDEVTALAELDVAWGQGYALAKPAAPWAEVSPIAAEVCRATLAQALRAAPALGEAVAAGDRRLEHLSARLAAVRSRRDLKSVLALIAAELDADQVCVSQLDRSHEELETLAENGTPTGDTVYSVHDYPLTSHVIATRESAQVRVGDPSTDPSEAKLLLALGHRSLLMVPVVSRGETLGIIESYRRSETPWTRTDINRARIISSQFASVIESLRHEPRAAS